jgi:excisionase family DNA binding protein
MPTSSKPKTISTREACKTLGVSGRTCRRFIQLGVLRAEKTTDSPHQQNRWRVRHSDVKRLAKARAGIKA